MTLEENQDGVQQRVEYRVAYEIRSYAPSETYEVPLADPESLDEARSRLTRLPADRVNPRIQSRTVTETPWSDFKRVFK